MKFDDPKKIRLYGIDYHVHYIIKMNEYTYEHIFSMLIDLRKYDGILDLYTKMRENGIMPTQKTLNILLESSMRSNDANGRRSFCCATGRAVTIHLQLVVGG